MSRKSTGTRRLNFTRRSKLLREDIDIEIHQAGETDPPVFSANIKLERYDLPQNARVFVEAYRHASWKRFDFGTVAARRAPDDRALHDFGNGEGVRFRVKVVEACSFGAAAARIVAQADRIQPKKGGPRRSLLPLDPDPSLREEVWKLELDEDDGPIIKISTHLVRDRHALARSPAFLSLVLPAVLRQVLNWALNDGLPEGEDWDSPKGLWIRFGCGLLGQHQPPEDIEDSCARDAWIDQAVTQFCRRNQLDRAFAKWWNDGVAQ